MSLVPRPRLGIHPPPWPWPAISRNEEPGGAGADDNHRSYVGSPPPLATPRHHDRHTGREHTGRVVGWWTLLITLQWSQLMTISTSRERLLLSRETEREREREREHFILCDFNKPKVTDAQCLCKCKVVHVDVLNK